MFVAEVMDRIEDQLPELAHRVHGAADLARLMAKGSAPQVTPAVHVLPGGIRGQRDGEGALALGMFRQAVRRIVSVVLTVRVHDALGARALDTLDTLIDRLVAAVCGWRPEPAPGPFYLVSARVLSLTGGALSYQIDFQLSDEMRILP